MFLAQGGCATILDFARHEVGFLASIWEWRIDRRLYLHLWGRLGNAQRSANQARGMVRGHYSGYVERGWMGTLGEGEPNTVGRAELMACVVAAESTRGNVVYVTDYQILKKRQDRGWPVPRLGQGSNPDLWWRLSRALKTRQGTFTVQWQRAHIDVADIKTENHDMAIVFGNEMADAVAKKAASEAAVRRGAAAEQIAWVDAMAWQVQRRIIEANLQASKANPTVLTLREKGLRRVQYKTVLQALFQQTTHQLAFRRSRQRWECQTCKQSMGETSLVRWLRAGPCSGEIQTMQSIGNSLGMDVQQVRAGAYIPIGWKIVHPSHSVARNHVVLELCGMDIAIFVQVERAMFGSHQVVGTGCAEQNQAEIPASCKNEVAVTSDGI